MSDETVINGSWEEVVGPDGKGGIVSTSWSTCEREVTDADADSLQSLVKSLTATGTSLFASSGDNGPTCVGGDGTRYANRVLYPAGVPDAVGVGGTTLQVRGGNAYAGENWWTSGDVGGGFGNSFHFARPAYQTPFTGSSGRSVPDVAAVGDPQTGIVFCQSGNCTTLFGGTSLSAPVWAGLWAVTCQARALGPLGATCPSANAGFLYALASSAFNRPAGMSGLGNDFTHLGLGSPNLPGLVSLVAGPPSVVGLSPASGPVTGGASVVISWNNFLGVSSVFFEGAGNSSFTVTSPTQIVATSPAVPFFNISGPQHVVVTTAAGPSQRDDASVFSYKPVVTGVSPSSGPIGGDTAVTVTGVNMDTPIAFGGIPSPNVRCNSDAECIAGSPPHPPGVVDVTVGGSDPNPSDRFTYQTPGITRIEPKIGPETGGIYVNIFGSGFAQGIGVDPSVLSIAFCQGTNCKSSASVTCMSSIWCDAFVPAGSGVVDIVARAANGVESARTDADRFTYAPFPTISGLAPVTGLATGATRVSVIGTNFGTAAGSTIFHFGPNPATDVSCDSSTHCTMTTPRGTGSVDVTASVGGNPSAHSFAAVFGYLPVVTNVSPSSGPAIGGTPVTVTGAGFVDRDPVGTVRSGSIAFGSTPASGSCSDASTCQVISSAGLGKVDVLVKTGVGTNGPVPADQFTYDLSGSPKGWTKWNFPLIEHAPDALAYDADRKVIVAIASFVDDTSVDPCPPPEELPPGRHCTPPPPKLEQVTRTLTWAADGAGWTQLSPAVLPHPAVRWESMSFHAASGKMVLFGGQTLRGVPDAGRVGNATWLWDGSTWSDANPAMSPPPRFGASIAYDESRHEIVLFGGCSTRFCTPQLNDTWTWDGHVWTQRNPSQAPPSRSFASLAFDKATGKTVLFGGEDANGFLGDTWQWDGRNWTKLLTSVSPSPRRQAAMAGLASGIILFGGVAAGLPPIDTWSFDGSAWVQLKPSISPTASAPMSFHAAKGEAVCLCGGGETWTWGGQ